MKFGVHTGPQNCSYEDLRRAWRTADDNGFLSRTDRKPRNEE
jgi:hypothetical protein